MPPLDLDALDEPLEPVRLPRGGRTLAAMDFDLGMDKLAKRVDAGDEDAVLPLLRRCLPEITEAEEDGLRPREILYIFGHCNHRLAEVAGALKNVERAELSEAPSTPPSAPTTSASTPSPASPAPSAKTGSRKRVNRSGARSSPSTA